MQYYCHCGCFMYTYWCVAHQTMKPCEGIIRFHKEMNTGEICNVCYYEKHKTVRFRTYGPNEEEAKEEALSRKANLFKLLQDKGLNKDVFKEFYKFYKYNL